MRPPEHWHVRRRRQSGRWLWTLTGLSSLAVLVAIVWLLWPDGGPADARPRLESRCTHAPCDSEVLSAGSVSPPKIVARSAVIIECGTALYGKDPHRRMPPASLTKIATALVTVEHADVDAMVDVDVNSRLLVASTESTVMGLEPGQRMSVRDLLYGLLLPSGNDAAIALAEYVGGEPAAFVDMMNAEAERLGLQDTHFSNPHGLDQAGLYSSAYDMALLGGALLEHAQLSAIVRTKHYQPAWPGPEVWNGNELLGVYRGMVGVKIGYTERAGQTYVAAAQRDGRLLIVALMNSWDRYSDAAALFDWAFANTESAC
jgi:D-alanyl-D-alanine carboxypeptidase